MGEECLRNGDLALLISSYEDSTRDLMRELSDLRHEGGNSKSLAIRIEMTEVSIRHRVELLARLHAQSLTHTDTDWLELHRTFK